MSATQGTALVTALPSPAEEAERQEQTGQETRLCSRLRFSVSQRCEFHPVGWSSKAHHCARSPDAWDMFAGQLLAQ